MATADLTKEQQIQEEQYDVPYHWFFKPDEFRGRNYFGYTNAALRFAIKHGFKKENGRALDAGCGDARFTKTLIDSGVSEVAGLDYSEHALAFARVFLPNTLFEVKDLTKKEFSVEKPYNVVFLIETLEHIHPNDISQFVSNLAKCLTKDGLLVITVPATLLPMHDKHYQHFTRESLSTCVEADFDVLEVVGYNCVTYPFLSLVYKFMDNRWWEIRPLKRWFNTKVWTKYQCIGPAETGRGLLLVAKKK